MSKPSTKRSRFITVAIVAAAVLIFIVAAAVTVVRNPDHRLLLSAEEWEWLSCHDGKITIAADPNYPPLDFIDEAGRQDGLAEDLFLLIEQRLNIKFVRVNPSNWDDLLAMAREKKIDLVKCAVKTPDRTKFLLFSQPYIDIPTVIIVRNDNRRDFSMKDLSGMKVAVTRGYSIQEYVSRNFPMITLFPVENDKIALESVSSGESDAALSDLPTSSFFITKYRIANLRISGETGFLYRLAVGCRDDQPMLNSIIIKVLDSISGSEREALSRKWIPFDRNEFLFTRPFWILVVIAAGLVLGVFGGIRLWDFVLMLRVKEKTHQLEEHRHRLETLVAERDAEIRERIITEEALRESEERFRSYFELPFVGIAVISSDGRFINVNPCLCDIVGYSQNELSIMRLSDITAPEDLGCGIADRCIEDSQSMKAVYERRYRRRNGSYVDIEVAYMRINERRGDGFYYICVVRDVSEKKKAEKDLHDSNENLFNTLAVLAETQSLAALGGLVAGITHEVNTPLGIILAASTHCSDTITSLKNLYSSGHITRDVFEREIGIIEESNSIIRSNIQKAFELMSSFKQMSVDQTSSCVRDFDLKKCIDDVLLSIKPRTRKTPYVIQSDVPDGIMMKGCPGAISQIITNIVFNAILHGFDGRDAGTVKISAHADGGNVRIELSDDGVGMSKDVCSRIFDPFFTTKPGKGGSGLGMHLVMNLVRRNLKGSIECASEKGKGTVFVITLPLSSTMS